MISFFSCAYRMHYILTLLPVQVKSVDTSPCLDLQLFHETLSIIVKINSHTYRPEFILL